LQLSENERDALTELANLGVGRAAASLSRMVNEPIHLAVPGVELLTRAEAAAEMEARDPARLIAVRQDFAGSFSGHALLLFPESNSLELVRAVVGPQPSLDDIADLEEEALAEVGNVILNGYLATIANLLHQQLKISLPDVIRGSGRSLLDARRTEGSDSDTEAQGLGSQDDAPVLFLYIDFTVGTRGIRGYIAVIMNFPSLEALRALAQQFVERITGVVP
jgi:chemotaxis protein CheC